MPTSFGQLSQSHRKRSIIEPKGGMGPSGVRKMGAILCGGEPACRLGILSVLRRCPYRAGPFSRFVFFTSCPLQKEPRSGSPPPTVIWLAQ